MSAQAIRVRRSDDRNRLHEKAFQLKYLLFGIMGAVYFSKRFPPWMKYSWMFVNLLVLVVTQLYGTVGYTLSSGERAARDIFYSVMVFNVIVFSVLVLPVITYHFRAQIEAIITLDEEKFFVDARYDAKKIASSKRKIVQHTILQYLCINVYTFVHPLFLFFSKTDESYQNLDYYVFPIVWIDHVRSQWQYYKIFVTHFAVASVTSISIITFSIYVLVIGHELYAAYLGLRNFLVDISTTVEQQYDYVRDEITPAQMADASNRQPHDDSDHYRSEFETHRSQQLVAGIVLAVRVHQDLHRRMKNIKPFIELLFSSALITLVGDQCFFVYIMCSTNLGSFVKTKEIIGILYMNVFLYSYCHVGKLFNQMEKMISDQVYGIPWYHLTGQQRKTFHIFLSQTQKGVQFKGFGVYAMDMPVFLQCLKIVFSLYNILHQVLSK